MINGLQLLIGENYKLNEYITVYNPKVEDIIKFGERKYFNLVSMLTSTPLDAKSKLYEVNIDYESISDFDYFIAFYASLTPESTKLILGDVNLSEFKIMLNEETEEIVLVNPKSGAYIDNLIYNELTECIRKIHGIKKTTYEMQGNLTKQEWIDKEKHEIELQKSRFYTPALSFIANNANEFKELAISTFCMLERGLCHYEECEEQSNKEGSTINYECESNL